MNVTLRETSAGATWASASASSLQGLVFLMLAADGSGFSFAASIDPAAARALAHELMAAANAAETINAA